MNLCSIILLFGNFFHWTTAVTFEHKSYIITIDESVLKNVTVPEDTLNIDLSYFRIKSIDENALDGLKHIESLDLSGNIIQTLRSSTFSKLKKLKKLYLAHNAINSASEELVGLENLEILDLSDNMIFEIGSGDFEGLPESTKIEISGNSLQRMITTAGKLLKQVQLSAPDPPKNLSRRFVEQYPVKICQTVDGTVESVQETAKNESLGNCTQAVRMFRTEKNTLQLIQRDITNFKSGWYGQNLQYDSIDFSLNYITRITPELINDLPSDVSYIDLSSNRIEIIENNCIKNQHIRTIVIKHNVLSTVEDGALGKFNLTSLDVSWNKFKNADFVRTLPGSLKELYCRGNEISEIFPDSFRRLENLEILDMAHNKLKEIKSNAFEFVKNLDVLDVSFNRIENILRGTFNKNLNYLDMSSNAIRSIESGSFLDMNLKSVGLSHNKITDNCTLGAFRGSKMRVLDLSYNLMSKIERRTFEGISIGHKLKLKDNPIVTIEKGAVDDILGVYEVDVEEN